MSAEDKARKAWQKIREAEAEWKDQGVAYRSNPANLKKFNRFMAQLREEYEAAQGRAPTKPVQKNLFKKGTEGEHALDQFFRATKKIT